MVLTCSWVGQIPPPHCVKTAPPLTYVNNAAHELRIPLTTLHTNLQVMYADAYTTVEDYQAAAPVLDRTLVRLEELIADLLILAREEQEIQDIVAIKPLLREVLRELEPVASRQQVGLHVEEDGSIAGIAGIAGVCVQGSAPLLARVFSNLVENGMRYNKSGGEVRVTMAHTSDLAIVTVTDTGIGIPPGEQSRIFDRFYRVDRSGARHKGGSGLGLSIVAHIMQMHGVWYRLKAPLG